MINKPQLIAKRTFPSKLYLFYNIFKVQNMHFTSNHSESSFCESFPIYCLPNIFPNRHNNSLIVLVPAFENQLAASFSGCQNIKYKYMFNDRLLAPPPPPPLLHVCQVVLFLVVLTIQNPAVVYSAVGPFSKKTHHNCLAE